MFAFEERQYLKIKNYHFRVHNFEVWWHETFSPTHQIQQTDVFTRALLVARYTNKQIK